MSTPEAHAPPALGRPAARSDRRRPALIGYTGFVLIGWSGLLVPSLIRDIERDFVQSDAGLGVFYFVGALSYAIGGMAGGLLVERFGRRRVLPLAAASLGIGLGLQALAPGWTIFLLAGFPVGLGGGGIDGGINGLFLDLHSDRPGGALNQLHLFFSVGALTAPLMVGALVGLGLPWQAILLVTSGWSIAVALSLAATEMPSGRHQGRRAPGAPTAAARLLTAPLVMLGIGIACYVASEVGVSNWLVRFLGSAPLSVATASLSLFWGGLALGRLLAARTADRFEPVRFATLCALGAGAALVLAIAVPWLPVSIALFALAGLAEGPIYPMIMAIGGNLHPGRSGAVSGVLTTAAVVGGLVYPPVIGFISVSHGIGLGMLGAGALALGSALALAAAGLLARRAANPRTRPS